VIERVNRTRQVSIRIPTVLFDYLTSEAERFGMSVSELI
jgi:hypothetical protein